MSLPDWARAIRQRREALGKSQGQLARESQGRLNQTEISRLERGLVHPTQSMGAAKLEALLRALDWTPADFAHATGLEYPGLGLQAVGALPYRPHLRVPLLGEVAAGMHPVEVLGEREEYLMVDEEFLPKGTRRDRLFALRVVGDSMISDELVGIPPGSVVLAEADRLPAPGEIVVVWVRCPKVGFEGGVIKVWSEGDDGQVLKSLNPKGPVFRLFDCDEVRVQGVFRLVMTPPSALRRR